ncbi:MULTISPECIES: phycobilisome rod-core linker polypeptide [Moorena]|uniref:Photosystem I reaction center subunit XII n=1 Tax=Moorena bouillonii PNG TaxID=568701 RepID=A0A1U7N8Q4_9CYAN|nr:MULTISPECIES: phycobilisome rod-core linker polypeptide [Moorena]NEO11769.1 photosystem I reaction center subunit XII [Moorena sp. SIO3E8]NEO43542.1 photosystem I reaction center subunit XII [Moorena sp. SIO4A3]NEP98330.1 photosystem I reaction center subunit XII [Moorena sp. SIO3F7]OLT62323.1 photosystem I reaction center subunit XII [Moorena bouillonii PNG]
MSLWVMDADPVELRPGATEDDVQTVIRAVYKQVLGNPHLLESDRLTSAESMLRNGDISVRGFVRMVAKSELYKSLFFDSASQYRFIELNYKHFLGRAPQDQTEIAEHVLIYNAAGYDADIDSYIDSDEYQFNFGEFIVPYPRSNTTEVGIKNVAFNRTFCLMRGDATSDSSNQAKLISDLAANVSTKITAPAGGSGTYANTGKRFKVTVAKAGVGSRFKRSNATYEVGYDQLSARIQNMHKMGSKIVSITEIG